MFYIECNTMAKGLWQSRLCRLFYYVCNASDTQCTHNISAYWNDGRAILSIASSLSSTQLNQFWNNVMNNLNALAETRPIPKPNEIDKKKQRKCGKSELGKVKTFPSYTRAHQVRPHGSAYKRWQFYWVLYKYFFTGVVCERVCVWICGVSFYGSIVHSMLQHLRWTHPCNYVCWLHFLLFFSFSFLLCNSLNSRHVVCAFTQVSSIFIKVPSNNIFFISNFMTMQKVASSWHI